jgi:hypothetical protein
MLTPRIPTYVELVSLGSALEGLGIEAKHVIGICMWDNYQIDSPVYYGPAATVLLAGGSRLALTLIRPPRKSGSTTWIVAGDQS